jgi:hypothetical protein
MDETPYPVAADQTCSNGRVRRSRKLNRAVAGLTWGLGALVCGLVVISWLHGAPATATGLVNTFIVGVGCGLAGLLALSGDGDVILLTGADEGQREAIYRASAPAFSTAYFGLFALWVGQQLWPGLRSHLDLGVGVLLALIVVVYLGTYVRRRWQM